MNKILVVIMTVMVICGSVFADEITKQGNYSIKVTKQDPLPAPTETIYEYDFLIRQKAQIEIEIANMNLELEKVNGLINEAVKLGVVSRPKELPPELK